MSHIVMKSLISGVALALLATGCNRDSVAEKEKRERSNALVAEAMAAEGSGNTAGAETLYRKALERDPALASAHLSLAMLLHDARKDYLGAMAHYQIYLDLQPTAEKAPIVRDRLESAKGLLATQVAEEIVAREQRALAGERAALKTQIAKLEEEVAALRKASAEKDATIADLQSRIKQLRSVVDAMKSTDVGNAPAEDALKAGTSSAEPTSQEALLDSIRKDAQRMIEEPDGGQKAQNEMTRKAAEGVQDDAPLATTPTPGKRYLVRPGDTLSRLSREAYGNASDWGKIREANRSTTNPDGRLRAGETILIP